MDNPIEDLRGRKATDLMRAVDCIIGFERVKVDAKEALPFVMYRSYTDADGNVQMVEMARGTCSDIVDLGQDVPMPEPRKFENWATLSIDFPAGNWRI